MSASFARTMSGHPPTSCSLAKAAATKGVVTAVMHPTMKHWVKRPLHDQLVEYAVGAVNPLWELGARMMKSVGEAGVAGTIRMSKQSIQYYYDAQHKDMPDEERRYVSSSTA